MRFVFVHTPRTAGGTINKLLTEMYPDDTCVLIDSFVGEKVDRIRMWYPHRDRYIKSVDEVRHFSIITGHIPFYKVKHFKRPFITWIRHPVERVISHYNTTLNRQDFNYASILDFALETKNLMTYFTGGDLSRYDFIGRTEKFDEDVKKLLDVDEYEKAHVTKKKIKVDDYTKDFIRNVNDKDMELYKCKLM